MYCHRNTLAKPSRFLPCISPPQVIRVESTGRDKVSTIGVLVPPHLLREVQVAIAALQTREALEAASRPPQPRPGERLEAGEAACEGSCPAMYSSGPQIMIRNLKELELTKWPYRRPSCFNISSKTNPDWQARGCLHPGGFSCGYLHPPPIISSH
jgi:hypothetical protein